MEGVEGLNENHPPIGYILPVQYPAEGTQSEGRKIGSRCKGLR